MKALVIAGGTVVAIVLAWLASFMATRFWLVGKW